MKSDDPNLTAYALGELDPEALAAASKDLAGSPEVAAEAWEIRAFGAKLRQALEKEPAPRLRPEQRSRLHAEVDRAAAIIEAERAWWRGWVPTAIAAAAALMIGGSLFVQKQQFAQWWAKTTQWDLSSLFADETATKANDSGIPPVDPSIQDRPIYRVAPATPQLPPPDPLSLPPPPRSTARLTQPPPPLEAEKVVAAPTVDPATIPMKGRLRVTNRSERVRTTMGGAAPAASPTPAETPAEKK